MNHARTPWVRFAAAAAAGAVWASAFPLPNIAGLAWIAPALLLGCGLGCSPAVARRVVYTAGVTHYLLSLSWLRFIPFPAGAFAAWFALSFFLALFPVAWLLACRRLASCLRLPLDTALDWRAVADRWTAAGFWRLNAWLIACAASWVALDMLLARLFGGFPWNLLGASQYRILPLLQLASWTGVHGVTFLIVWFSLGLLTAVLLLARDPRRKWTWRAPLLLPAWTLTAVAVAGVVALRSESTPHRQLAVALIQPSIPQTVIFDPNSATNRFETLLRLTEHALTTQPDLVLWPEASLPGGLAPEEFARLAATIRQARVWMIFGADDVVGEPGPDGKEQVRAYNSAFLMNPDGEVVATYRKQRLVMFGEYIPFIRWFPFLQRIAPIGDGFTPGPGPVSFTLPDLRITASVLICFEDNFPQQARRHAVDDIDFLINLTNDAWFGTSAAQWQHAANATFRAIENGLPLIRCCNNGITCWIDPSGRLHSARIAQGLDPYSEGFEIASLDLRTPRPTVYRRFGDVFGWSCVVAVSLALRPDRLRFRTTSPPHPASSSIP